jgi:hypothetical protein
MCYIHDNISGQPDHVLSTVFSDSSLKYLIEIEMGVLYLCKICWQIFFSYVLVDLPAVCIHSSVVLCVESKSG